MTCNYLFSSLKYDCRVELDLYNYLFTVDGVSLSDFICILTTHFFLFLTFISDKKPFTKTLYVPGA